MMNVDSALQEDGVTLPPKNESGMMIRSMQQPARGFDLEIYQMMGLIFLMAMRNVSTSKQNIAWELVH